MKYILALFCVVSLSSCTINTVSEDWLRQWLGKTKRDVEMDFGEPVFCKPDTGGGEVCEWEQYRARWNDTLILRMYFNKNGRCTEISTR